MPHTEDLPDRSARAAAPEDWEATYATTGQVWSGRPNDLVVREVADLPPATVLEVGCGEGADAIWLAAKGWQVTAIDVAGVALERAEIAAEVAGVTVDWRHLGLEDLELAPEGYALVTVSYPALRHDHGDPLRRLLRAVAPGGTLLITHHAEAGVEWARERGIDLADYVSHEDVVAALGAGWQVVTGEHERAQVEGRGAHHRLDRYVRATREV